MEKYSLGRQQGPTAARMTRGTVLDVVYCCLTSVTSSCHFLPLSYEVRQGSNAVSEAIAIIFNELYTINTPRAILDGLPLTTKDVILFYQLVGRDLCKDG